MFKKIYSIGYNISGLIHLEVRDTSYSSNIYIYIYIYIYFTYLYFL